MPDRRVAAGCSIVGKVLFRDQSLKSSGKGKQSLSRDRRVGRKLPYPYNYPPITNHSGVRTYTAGIRCTAKQEAAGSRVGPRVVRVKAGTAKRGLGGGGVEKVSSGRQRRRSPPLHRLTHVRIIALGLSTSLQPGRTPSLSISLASRLYV